MFTSRWAARAPLSSFFGICCRSLVGVHSSSLMPPPGRGYRQRLGLPSGSSSNSASSSSVSAVTNFLSGQYKSGRLTAKEFAEGARAECEDTEAPNPVASRVAAAAPTKKYRTNAGERLDTRNTSRGIQRAFKSRSKGLPEAYTFSCPLWDVTGATSVDEEVSMILPHDLMDNLPEGSEFEYCSYDATQQGLYTDLREWGYRTEVDIDDGVPTAGLALWGDAAPYQARDSIYLLVLTILSGQHRMYYWLSCFTKRRTCACGCQGRHTFDMLFKVLAWSFRACMANRHPSVDHMGQLFDASSPRGRQAGQPIRARAALLRFLGDWAWMKQSLGLRGWRAEGPQRQICWRCAASVSGSCPCYDFSPAAAWQSARIDMSKFWARTKFERVFISELWRTPGFHIKWVEPDFMHCVCLGILQVLQGNICWELFKHFGGVISNHRDALAKLNALIKAVCHELGRDVLQLTMGMVRSKMSKAPKLKLKAAEGRRFLPVLVHILQHCFPSTEPHDALRLQCARNLLLVYQEMDAWVDEGGESLANFRRYGMRHLILFAELCREKSPTGEALEWRLYPKHHLCAHVFQDATDNPKATWAYRLAGVRNTEPTPPIPNCKGLHFLYRPGAL